MKTVKSNLLVLLAQKQQEEGRRISLQKLAQEAGVKPYTLYALANDTLKEYPGEALARLCEYFECEVGDLLRLEEMQAEQ